MALARRVGADAAVNVATDPDALPRMVQETGGFGAAFEVSGNPAGLASCLHAVRPGATMVQATPSPASAAA